MGRVPGFLFLLKPAFSLFSLVTVAMCSGKASCYGSRGVSWSPSLDLHQRPHTVDPAGNGNLAIQVGDVRFNTLATLHHLCTFVYRNWRASTMLAGWTARLKGGLCLGLTVVAGTLAYTQPIPSWLLCCSQVLWWKYCTSCTDRVDMVKGSQLPFEISPWEASAAGSFEEMAALWV